VCTPVTAGLLRDRSGFSKHQYGTATLFPDMAQVVPYWIDDGGVRASMFASLPEQLPQLAPT